MSKVVTALSVSLDGYIAGPDDGDGAPLGRGGERLFRWFGDGDTPSAFYPHFRMSKVSAAVFDAGARAVGAVITGRRTYDISKAWNGDGPMPGLPVFVLTHHLPAAHPEGKVPFDFVTEGGIETAVSRARAAANGKNVALMGTAAVQQALAAGLLDEIALGVVPVLLGGGRRLLDGVPADLELVQVVDAPGVTHLTYHVPH